MVILGRGFGATGDDRYHRDTEPISTPSETGGYTAYAQATLAREKRLASVPDEQPSISVPGFHYHEELALLRYEEIVLIRWLALIGVIIMAGIFVCSLEIIFMYSGH
jgi:hypothetical protein